MWTGKHLNFSPLSLEWPNPALSLSLCTSAICSGNCTDTRAFPLHLCLWLVGLLNWSSGFPSSLWLSPTPPLNAQKLSLPRSQGGQGGVLEKQVVSVMCLEDLQRYFRCWWDLPAHPFRACCFPSFLHYLPYNPKLLKGLLQAIFQIILSSLCCFI